MACYVTCSQYIFDDALSPREIEYSIDQGGCQFGSMLYAMRGYSEIFDDQSHLCATKFISPVLTIHHKIWSMFST